MQIYYGGRKGLSLNTHIPAAGYHYRHLGLTLTYNSRKTFDPTKPLYPAGPVPSFLIPFPPHQDDPFLCFPVNNDIG